MDNQTPAPTGAPSPATPFPTQLKAPPPAAFPPPGADARFPARTAGQRLVLPRRVNPLQRAQEATQATAAARKSIDAIKTLSRSPWTATGAAISSSQVEDLEKSLRVLEAKVGEREMALAEAERKLAERDRALAETEALLQARETIIEAMRKQSAEAGAGAPGNPEEMEALGKLKEELDRQEASMQEQRDAIREREEFLEQSEASLFEKMQAQQEKETELEQKAEDIKRAMKNAGMLKEEPKEPMEKA